MRLTKTESLQSSDSSGRSEGHNKAQAHTTHFDKEENKTQKKRKLNLADLTDHRAPQMVWFVVTALQ